MGKDRTAVVRAGAIGDLIEVSAAISSYKKQHPDTELTLFCGESCLEAVAGNPHIDRLSTFDDKKLYTGSLTARLAVAAELVYRLKGFTRCFVLHRDLRWRMLPRIAGIMRVSRIPDSGNRFEGYARCMGLENIYDARCRFHPEICSPTLPQKPYIAIAPGGAANIQRNTPCRRWAGFQHLTQLIISDTDKHIVFLGLKGDSPGIRHGRTTDLCGHTNLSDAYHIINGAEAFIGNDSGLLHLAACTGTARAGIFTATDPLKEYIHSSGITAFTSPMACSPCENNGKFSTSCAYECCSSISADDIFEWIKRTIC